MRYRLAVVRQRRPLRRDLIAFALACVAGAAAALITFALASLAGAW